MTWKIKNWSEFQHYKHRDPPWIKLHRRLQNDRQWHMLSGDDAKALIGLWLIASERAGSLLADEDLAFRLYMKPEEIPPLFQRLSHWIKNDANGALSVSKLNAVPEESRAEESRELENSPREFSNSRLDRSSAPPAAPLAEGSRPPGAPLTQAEDNPMPIVNGLYRRPTDKEANDYRSPPRKHPQPSDGLAWQEAQAHIAQNGGRLVGPNDPCPANPATGNGRRARTY